MGSDLASSDVFPHTVDKWTVTEETLVDVYLGTDQNISAGDETLLNLDTENKDELGEFDTGTHQFTPEETGWYLMTTAAQFAVGADGDRLRLIIYNATAGSQISNVAANAGAATNEALTCSAIKKLTAGDSYVVHVLNMDSNDTVFSGENLTFLQVRRMFR